ncbi:hypothetical protein FA15DRAFT_654338 [Coprinopsis marcescibilis]|uniref:AAA+ ATPase domain-containing protein n=1 Tax=Coprinopsis marcescibilis TaxID=230819 RepID=A0A5C3L1F4_COPMA|nr:hypothetical protein FA15DRAFT_654338 [Coprinopsis marcescibilis]
MVLYRRLDPLPNTANRIRQWPPLRLGFLPKTPYTQRFHAAGDRAGSRVPASIDSLERYHSLVTLGKITRHEDQIRVLLQLRKLQRELTDYAPPALSARLLKSAPSTSELNDGDETPWWKFSPEEEEVDKDIRALVTHKGHAEELAALTTPKGLLLTGPPGSGKSFIIDLWYSTLPTPFKAQKHYNQLVLEIYRSVWEETQRRMQHQHNPNNAIRTQSATFSEANDARIPWNKVVRDQWRNLVQKNKLPIKWLPRTRSTFFSYDTDPTIAFLLVFDEIQLLDVSSAGLLSDVLSWYWRMGGIVVGTSNKLPDDLYKNGVQRERLEPFVEALKARSPLFELDVRLDWREEMGKRDSNTIPGPGKTWFTMEQKDQYESLLQTLTASLPGGPHSRDLKVFGRALHVPWVHGRICQFTFAQLCEASLGAADYLTLASTFSHMAITSVPILLLSSKNQARRFISLIDALYESKCKLICLADGVPERIFFPDAVSATSRPEIDNSDLMLAETIVESQEYYRPNVSSYSSAGIEEQEQKQHTSRTMGLALDSLSIFSGQDEQFAFKRALSRIQEMSSVEYNSESYQWAPLPADQRRWEISNKLSTNGSFNASSLKLAFFPDELNLASPISTTANQRRSSANNVVDLIHSGNSDQQIVHHVLRTNGEAGFFQVQGLGTSELGSKEDSNCLNPCSGLSPGLSLDSAISYSVDNHHPECATPGFGELGQHPRGQGPKAQQQDREPHDTVDNFDQGTHPPTNRDRTAKLTRSYAHNSYPKSLSAIDKPNCDRGDIGGGHAAAALAGLAASPPHHVGVPHQTHCNNPSNSAFPPIVQDFSSSGGTIAPPDYCVNTAAASSEALHNSSTHQPHCHHHHKPTHRPTITNSPPPSTQDASDPNPTARRTGAANSHHAVSPNSPGSGRLVSFDSSCSDGNDSTTSNVNDEAPHSIVPNTSSSTFVDSTTSSAEKLPTKEREFQFKIHNCHNQPSAPRFKMEHHVWGSGTRESDYEGDDGNDRGKHELKSGGGRKKGEGGCND